LEGLSLEDLCKYRSSLKDLWASEDFRPVLCYLAQLYREACDAIAYKKYGKAEDDQAYVVEWATTAKIANNMFNLPEVLEKVEQSFAQQGAVRAKMAAENAPLAFEKPKRSGP
jgi:hydroxylamine reductase (hybrid-cluster protein)